MQRPIPLTVLSVAPVRSTGAWATVILLSLITVISWLDRQILTMLVTHVQTDLLLTDGEFGVLLGLGFVTVFVLAGLPIASALDRGNRKCLAQRRCILHARWWKQA